MFLRHLGRQLLMAFALGLILLPAVSWAASISKPFSSYSATPPKSLSVVNFVGINTSTFNATTDATYTSDVATASPNNTFLGSLDLMNNDLIVIPAVQDEAHAIATYRAVNDMVRSAADTGAYDGPGITSSMVAQEANQKQLLAVGVLLNDDGSGVNADGSGNPLWGNPSNPNVVFQAFDGYTATNLTQYDTLVKYTWVGDLFLEGAVSTGDVNVIFSHIAKTFSGTTANPNTQTWNNGDVYYENTGGVSIPTSADIFAFNALQHQNDANPFGGAGGGSLSVPEPSTALLGSLGFLGLMFIAARKKFFRIALFS